MEEYKPMDPNYDLDFSKVSSYVKLALACSAAILIGAGAMQFGRDSKSKLELNAQNIITAPARARQK